MMMVLAVGRWIRRVRVLVVGWWICWVRVLAVRRLVRVGLLAAPIALIGVLSRAPRPLVGWLWLSWVAASTVGRVWVRAVSRGLAVVGVAVAAGTARKGVAQCV